MLHYVVLAPILYIFWLLLSGHYNLMFLMFGLASVLLSLWFQARMDRVDQEPAKFHFCLRLFSYTLWLLKEVVLSNIEVAKRIWQPDMAINPVWKRLDTRLKTPREKTLYANSITLTPGTLTTDVHDEYLMIHSLTPDMHEQLEQGEMENKISKLGI